MPMRWTIKPGTQPSSLEVPGGVLAAELERGIVRLTLTRVGTESGGRAETAAIANAGLGGGLVVRHGLPKVPVILMLDPPFALAADSSVLLGAELPLDIVVETRSGALVWEFVSPGYRKAWAGGLDGGETALAFRTQARTVEKPLDARADEGLSGISVLVSNLGKKRIGIDRVTAPTRNLRLYVSGNRFLCDGIAVIHESEGGTRTLVRSLKSIAPEASLSVVEEARESPQELFIRKGKRFLRSITGLEGR
jgi:hypothetical protein